MTSALLSRENLTPATSSPSSAPWDNGRVASDFVFIDVRAKDEDVQRQVRSHIQKGIWKREQARKLARKQSPRKHIVE